jgi:asparagine synthetase B (glutamine-hydrolysing)
MNGVSQQIRDYLIGYLRALKLQRVVISTSGGIDSSTLVVAALKAGCDVAVSSFTLNDRESEDFRGARKLAQYFGLEFIPVLLPTDENFIINSTLDNMKHYRLRGKADIECFYPILYMIRYLANLNVGHLIMGHGCDGYFCLSKKGMIHYRHNLNDLRSFRKQYFLGGQLGQRKVIYKAAKEYGISYYDPFWGQQLYDLLINRSWAELNKPRQKEVLRVAFPELNPLRIKNHTNLQLGDSGIAEAVGKAMLAKYTPQGKSAISAYNAVVRRGLVEA